MNDITAKLACYTKKLLRPKTIDGAIFTSAALLKAVEESEKDYLGFGSDLRRIHDRVMEVSKVSASLAEMSEDKGLNDLTRGLQDFFDKNRGLETESGQAAAILESILERVIRIESQLRTFRNVVRTLQVLCNLIKIESIRSGEGKQDFNALADDVAALVRNIEEKSSSVLEQARSLTIFVKQNLVRVLSFEQGRQEEGRVIAGKIMDELGALSEQHHASSKRRVRISAVWEEITKSIGEIVNSLQFHDITRQRIEHVAEAIRKFSEGDDATESYKGYQLQRAQLLHTKEELASATERIGKELRNLSRRIVEMSREAGEGMENSRGSFFSALEKAVVELSEAVNRHSEINREMASTIDGLSATVSQMEGFVKDIVRIGIRMKMIALNAAIHAAHVGEQGLALGVLAEQIHSLSEGTSGQIASIDEDLHCIVDHADRLKDSSGVVSRRKAEEGLQMVEALKCAIPSLRELDAQATAMLKSIETEGEGLFTETLNRAEELHFHEEILEGIESLASEIDCECRRIGKRFKRKSGGESSGIVGMEELLKSYTMQREREVHQSMLGRAEAGEGAPSSGPGPDGEKRKGSGEEELGENVELF